LECQTDAALTNSALIIWESNYNAMAS